MSKIIVYKNLEKKLKIAEIQIEPYEPATPISRNRGIKAEISWAVKDDQIKREFLVYLSKTKMLAGHSSPSFESLSERPLWVFPSLNDFAFMLDGLPDIYQYEEEDLPKRTLDINTYSIPYL